VIAAIVIAGNTLDSAARVTSTNLGLPAAWTFLLQLWVEELGVCFTEPVVTGRPCPLYTYTTLFQASIRLFLALFVASDPLRMALTNEEVQRELQDMKTKVYLPSSYNEVAARFAELVTNHLNDETRDAFFGDSSLKSSPPLLNLS